MRCQSANLCSTSTPVFCIPKKQRAFFPTRTSSGELAADAGRRRITPVCPDSRRQEARASVACRLADDHHGWMSQHLVCENNPYASRAVMLAAAPGDRKGLTCRKNWFRQRIGFPLGCSVRWCRPSETSLVSAKACVFRFAQNTIAAHGKPNSHRTVQSIAQRSAFGNRFGRARKHLCRGGRATAGRRIQCCRRTVRSVGLRRTRHVWLLIGPTKTNRSGPQSFIAVH